MSYYKQIQHLAQVDRNDKIIGRVEKWQTHRKNILHRGFTAILYFQNQVILQHRKHPVFDGVYDLSFSSHQIYVGEKLQDDSSAINVGLKREWNLEKKDLIKPPEFLTKFYYQAKDPDSQYSEHEIDYIYQVRLNRLPQSQREYAYGMEIISQSALNTINKQFPKLTPWAKEIIRIIK